MGGDPRRNFGVEGLGVVIGRVENALKGGMVAWGKDISGRVIKEDVGAHIDNKGFRDIGVDAINTGKSLDFIVAELPTGEFLLFDFSEVGKMVSKIPMNIGVSWGGLQGLNVKSILVF